MNGATSDATILYVLKELRDDPAATLLRADYEYAVEHRPKIGIRLREEFGTGEIRIVIYDVTEGSPAARGGIKVNDIVMAVGGRPVGFLSDVVEAIAESKPGSTIQLAVLRGDQTAQVNVTTTGADYATAKKRVLDCFPELVEAIRSNNETRRQEIRSRMADASRKTEEQRREQSKAQLRSTPEYVLGNAYINYIRVKKCYEMRLGYATVFIVDDELKLARKAVSRLEEIHRNSSLGTNTRTGLPWTTDSMWEEAQRIIDNDVGEYRREKCQEQLGSLLSAYRKAAPEEMRTQKDF